MPLSEVTILALTERAKVGYATFFRNYPDIDAVLADLSGVLIDELSALILQTTDQSRSIEVARAIAAFAAARRRVLTPLFVGASASLQREIIARAGAAARGEKPARADALPPHVAMSHPIVVIVHLLTWWLDDGTRCEEELAALIERLAFRPVESEPGKL